MLFIAAQNTKYFGYFSKKVCCHKILKSPNLVTLAPMTETILYMAATSVTRLGDLLDFGQLFKAFGNN